MVKYKKRMYLILLFMFSLMSVFWMFSERNSFCFDDTTWMLRVSTASYPELFTFMPHSAYLDRPIGVIFMKLLYDLFGLDYGCHHAVLIIIHLLNVLLTFLVFRQVFFVKYGNCDKSFLGGLITAAFFGIWARTHMAVQWDAAIFDLLGVFFSLLSAWFYLRYKIDEKYKGQNLVLLLFFYYLAIRQETIPLLSMFDHHIKVYIPHPLHKRKVYN